MYLTVAASGLKDYYEPFRPLLDLADEADYILNPKTPWVGIWVQRFSAFWGLWSDI